MNCGNARGISRRRSSIRSRTASSPARTSADRHRSASQSSRCRFPHLTQIASPSPAPPPYHPPRAHPSATSARPAVHPRIADPAPATCTSSPDDPPDTSCPPDDFGTAPDAPDRSRTNQKPPPHSPAALRMTACRLHENKDCASSLPAAAMHRTPSTYRCQSETASLPSTAVSLCPSAKTQTTALRYFAENKPPCRCQTESPPAIFLAHGPSRHDSTALRPENSDSSCPLSPAARTSPPAHKNLPGPTSPPHSSSAPLVLSIHTPPRAASRIHHNSDAPQIRSSSESSRENTLRWRSKAAPAASKNRKRQSDRTENGNSP